MAVGIPGMSSLAAAIRVVAAFALVIESVGAFGSGDVAVSPLAFFAIPAGIGKHGDMRRQGLGGRVQPHFGGVGVAVAGAAAIAIIGLGSTGPTLSLRPASA